MLEYTNTYWMDKPNTEVPDYHSFHQRRMEYLMKCVVSNQSVVDAQCIVSVQKDICRYVLLTTIICLVNTVSQVYFWMFLCFGIFGSVV
jgi:hypothetical protein